jgi:LemA protein
VATGDETAPFVETVRGYAKQESEVLVRASRARSMLAATTGVADKGRLLGDLDNAIAGVLLLAESYPDLKAVENFLALLKATETSKNLLLASR